MSAVEKLNTSHDPRFPTWAECEYISFTFNGVTESGKTAEYDVNAKEPKDWLGTIAWYGRWRCYAFTPAPSTIFEKTCMRDVADFCEKLTKEHYARARENRNARARKRTGKVRA